MRILFTGDYLTDYNRTLILRVGLQKLGHEIIDYPFKKNSAKVAAGLRENAAKADFVFLPSFTHRQAAFVRKILPTAKIAFDPLISQYMTRIFDYKRAWRWSLGALSSFYRDKKSQAAADLVFTDTEEHRRYFHRQFGTPLEKMSVLYIGNNFADFYPQDRTFSSSRAFHVGFYGGFIPLQGVLKILAAAKILRDQERTDIVFDLVGNGFEYEKALHYIKENDLQNVLTPGWIPYPQLRERLLQFDIALGIFGDGIKTQVVIPNKIYHYAACGLAIITKQTSAISEIFTNDKDILTVEGSPESIVEAILRLKDDASLRERLGRSAFQTINTGYNEVKVAEQFIAAANRHLLKDSNVHVP